MAFISRYKYWIGGGLGLAVAYYLYQKNLAAQQNTLIDGILGATPAATGGAPPLSPISTAPGVTYAQDLASAAAAAAAPSQPTTVLGSSGKLLS